MEVRLEMKGVWRYALGTTLRLDPTNASEIVEDNLSPLVEWEMKDQLAYSFIHFNIKDDQIQHIMSATTTTKALASSIAIHVFMDT